jgi:hypothetical protein
MIEWHIENLSEVYGTATWLALVVVHKQYHARVQYIVQCDVTVVVLEHMVLSTTRRL